MTSNALQVKQEMGRRCKRCKGLPLLSSLLSFPLCCLIPAMHIQAKKRLKVLCHCSFDFYACIKNVNSNKELVNNTQC